ncbi:MAG: protein kinase domain-containing protein [Planctomycetota bacterium]|jgi:serine/threonine-protein kinase
MTVEHASEDGGLEDLGRFGFDEPGDGWMDRFRAVAAPESLGSIGPYEILHEVDRGGQGVVYCARQPGTQRRIAVKRLRAGSFATAAMRRRFDREIEIASSLSHPHVVNVFAVDVIDGQPTLAMQWVDGAPITTWARGRRVRERLELFARVCDAVGHAHRKGVIHRDLKPSNVLVEETDRGFVPRVLDFGLARMQGPSSGDSVTDDFVGTLAYAAPEQVAGRPEEVDVRADVYALGVILYRMLTEQSPYPVDGALAAVVRAIEHDAPRRPSALNGSLDEELDAIVLQALAKSPADRYASVEALRTDVERYLDGAPVLAHPQSRAYLLRKFAQRHRLACAFALVTAILVLAFTAALVVAVNDAEDEREVAEQVSAFLRDTLSFAGPAVRGGDVSVMEMMAEASDRVAGELADRPRVAAEVYFTIGSTYANLWRWDDAVDPLERALALTHAAYGEQDERTARCLTALGRARSNQGDPDSVALQARGLAIRQALYGDRDPRVAESKMRLGYALYRAARPRRFDEAEAYLVDALQTYRATVGPVHRDVASCLHNFGYLRLTQNRLDEAEVLYRDALEMLREIGDRTDPFYIECMHGYTALLLQIGRYQDSIDHLDELIPLVRERYGQARAPALIRRYARAQQALEDYDGAIRMWREYIASTAAELALERPEHERALRSIAHDDAPVDEILDVAAALPDGLQLRITRGVVLLAGALRESGDPVTARSIFERVFSMRLASSGGGPDASAALALEGLGDVAHDLGRRDEAARDWEESLSMLEEISSRRGLAKARIERKLDDLSRTRDD